MTTIATTAIFPLHKSNSRSVAKALKGSIDYLTNPLKTEDGRWVSSYECSAETADLEFNLSKQRYLSLTGKDQGDSDVIAYHARQSFAPGEITPEEANRIGYELAMRFTKGRNAFIVCTHTDKNHIHNHLVWNSTRLDCRKKFRNFIGSAFALRRCSDILCAENGLSVIKDPSPSPGKDYAKHVYSANRAPLFQDQIRQAIDKALEQSPRTYEDFIALISATGITAKRRGRHMRFKMPGQRQFTRLNTLRGDYTEDAIRERIAGIRIVGGSVNMSSRVDAISQYKPSLLIDIQAKLTEGRSDGYAHWASVQNLKMMAKTLIYLQERGLDDFDVLKEKAEAASDRFNELSDRIKDLDDKLTANAALQKHIVTYSKTRAAYAAYRKSGYSKSFKAAHEADILLHQTAKKAFDNLGYSKSKKLPTVASLRAEYAPMLEEKKQAYRDYRHAKTEIHELVTARTNVERFLNLNARIKPQDNERPECR